MILRRADRELLGPYAASPRAVRLHLALRVATAPLPEVIAAVRTAGQVVEVGCGHGLVSLGVARANPEAHVLGVDIDAGRIEVARRAAARAGLANASFEVAGARWRPPAADAILLVDVLYLLEPDEQRRLVAHAAQRLRSGGSIVVKEVDDHPAWQARLAALQEQVAVRVHTRRIGSACSPPSSRTLVQWLREEGLRVDAVPVPTRGWWPHYVIVGRRDDGASTEPAPGPRSGPDPGSDRAR